MSAVTAETSRIVTVDPVAVRFYDKDEPHDYREIRSYLMPEYQAVRYVSTISSLAKYNQWDDALLFSVIEAMNDVCLDGDNARIIQVNGINILEDDYNRGFKTENRLFNIGDGDTKILYERTRFVKDAKDNIREITERFNSKKFNKEKQFQNIVPNKKWWHRFNILGN